LTASFAGDASYLASSTPVAFTITHEETATAFNAGSATLIADDHPATFSATLRADGTTAPAQAGKTVTFKLGAGTGAQTCNGTTGANGLATCTIASVNQPLGPNTVSASFAGDGYYSSSSASEPVAVFAFLSQGSMIIGDLDGPSVDFWGAQWATDNSLSGGPAPDSFKGFADTAPQGCGSGGWRASTGNSSGPPGMVPSYMGVMVASSAVQSGSSISGNVVRVAVIKTDPGYGPNPGHAGTGTLVGIYCQ
jgi:hypothetical protein